MHSALSPVDTARTAMAVISMWLTRREKRHAAVAPDFNALDTRLQSIEHSMQALLHKLDVRCVQESNQKLQDIDARVHRMEHLLFRTLLSQFKALDEEMESIMPQAARRPPSPTLTAMFQDNDEQPDKEVSPEKFTRECEPTCAPKCLEFDISSDTGEALQTSDLVGEEYCHGIWERLPSTSCIAGPECVRGSQTSDLFDFMAANSAAVTIQAFMRGQRARRTAAFRRAFNQCTVDLLFSIKQDLHNLCTDLT